MKATITADGALVVRPESELEAYALARWSESNFRDWANVLVTPPKLTTDCSDYPGAFGAIVARMEPTL